ncbi:MAG TPA: HPr(Ser) kinase/phosphatase [Elusimicrobiota bacterium]|nr:HPr(Ser) kinase/phosphatase [Elusimicrobiota bacterium]
MNTETEKSALNPKQSSPLKVEELWNEQANLLRLSLVAGQAGLPRSISVTEINRPGLTLAGFFEFYRAERIQVFGMGEMAFVGTLSSAQRMEIFDRIFSLPETPCVILTHDREPSPEMHEQCDRYQVPLFRSHWETARLIGELTAFLEERLAPAASVHGVLVSVYGLGVLIVGKSGVGKSECAMELLKRGHMLVADDVVEIRQKPGGILMGGGNPLVQHHMEVRGLGIIDVSKIFGVGALLNRSRIELVIHLEMWDEKKEYERMGLEDKKTTLLGVSVPEIRVPVHPGRNLAALIEVAALNQRLKQQGIHSAHELNERLIRQMASKAVRPA